MTVLRVLKIFPTLFCFIRTKGRKAAKKDGCDGRLSVASLSVGLVGSRGDNERSRREDV